MHGRYAHISLIFNFVRRNVRIITLIKKKRFAYRALRVSTKHKNSLKNKYPESNIQKAYVLNVDLSSFRYVLGNINGVTKNNQHPISRYHFSSVKNILFCVKKHYVPTMKIRIRYKLSSHSIQWPVIMWQYREHEQEQRFKVLLFPPFHNNDYQ